MRYNCNTVGYIHTVDGLTSSVYKFVSRKWVNRHRVRMTLMANILILICIYISYWRYKATFYYMCNIHNRIGPQYRLLDRESAICMIVCSKEICHTLHFPFLIFITLYVWALCNRYVVVGATGCSTALWFEPHAYVVQGLQIRILDISVGVRLIFLLSVYECKWK